MSKYGQKLRYNELQTTLNIVIFKIIRTQIKKMRDTKKLILNGYMQCHQPKETVKNGWTVDNTHTQKQHKKVSTQSTKNQQK